MSHISRRLPLAALGVAMVALFVALGANAIGAGRPGKAEPGATARAARSASLMTVRGPARTIRPGTQRAELNVLCPSSHPQVTGGGVFGDGGVLTSVNTSVPIVVRVGRRFREGWRIDYNNLDTVPVTVRVYVRCLRNV